MELYPGGFALHIEHYCTTDPQIQFFSFSLFLSSGVFNHRNELINEHEDLSKSYTEFDDVYMDLTKKVSEVAEYPSSILILTDIINRPTSCCKTSTRDTTFIKTINLFHLKNKARFSYVCTSVFKGILHLSRAVDLLRFVNLF